MQCTEIVTLTGSAQDSSFKAVEAWCAKKAVGIRHRAAALGHPVEYVYLKEWKSLEREAREEFGPRSSMAADFVEGHCYDSDTPLSLEEVNKIRAQSRLPPLEAIPRLWLYVLIPPRSLLAQSIPGHPVPKDMEPEEPPQSREST